MSLFETYIQNKSKDLIILDIVYSHCLHTLNLTYLDGKY
jgi:hypothetical protein